MLLLPNTLSQPAMKSETARARSELLKLIRPDAHNLTHALCQDHHLSSKAHRCGLIPLRYMLLG